MADYLGLCLALERAAPTQYAGYDFNSMAKFGDVYLGAGENGIFVLDSGDRDAGSDIEAFFELATSDWGAAHPKRIRRLYVSYEADGDLMLTVQDDEGRSRNFVLEPSFPDSKQHTSRVAIGRDGRGTYWMVRIDNLNGSDFSVDRIQVVPVLLGKKPSLT